MCVCLCVRMYVCMHVFECMYVLCVCMYVWMHVFMHVLEILPGFARPSLPPYLPPLSISIPLSFPNSFSPFIRPLGEEISNLIEWARASNLSINCQKTSEMVIRRKNQPDPPLNCGIARSSQLKILGVIVDEKLNLATHVS